MWLVIALMAVVVAGLNFLIERSSLTKNTKSIVRIAVLCMALASTYYWVRIGA